MLYGRRERTSMCKLATLESSPLVKTEYHVRLTVDITWRLQHFKNQHRSPISNGIGMPGPRLLERGSFYLKCCSVHQSYWVEYVGLASLTFQSKNGHSEGVLSSFIYGNILVLRLECFAMESKPNLRECFISYVITALTKKYGTDSRTLKP